METQEEIRTQLCIVGEVDFTATKHFYAMGVSVSPKEIESYPFLALILEPLKRTVLSFDEMLGACITVGKNKKDPSRLYIIPAKKGETWPQVRKRIISNHARKFAILIYKDGNTHIDLLGSQPQDINDEKYVRISSSISAEDWITWLSASYFTRILVEHSRLPADQPREIIFEQLLKGLMPKQLFYNKNGQIEVLSVEAFQQKVSSQRQAPFVYDANFYAPKFIIDVINGELSEKSEFFNFSSSRFVSFYADLEAGVSKDPSQDELVQHILNVDSESKIYFEKIPAIGGLGVFASQALQAEEYLGFYGSHFTDALYPFDTNSQYSFKTFEAEKTNWSTNQSFFGFSQGNFLPFINDAPTKGEYATANVKVEMVNYRGVRLVAYKTNRPIRPGEQLLIDYGVRYSKGHLFFSKDDSDKVVYAENITDAIDEVSREGVNFLKEENYKKAKNCLKQSVALCEVQGSKRGIGAQSANLAGAYLGLAKQESRDQIKREKYFKKATSYLSRARMIYKQYTDADGRAGLAFMDSQLKEMVSFRKSMQ